MRIHASCPSVSLRSMYTYFENANCRVATPSAATWQARMKCKVHDVRTFVVAEASRHVPVRATSACATRVYQKLILDPRLLHHVCEDSFCGGTSADVAQAHKQNCCLSVICGAALQYMGVVSRVLLYTAGAYSMYPETRMQIISCRYRTTE
jgi:hypothetical protein